MPLKNTREEWGVVSKTLHWLVVALILAMAWLGLTMGDLPNGPDKIATYALHKSIGLTILALVLLRLGWRLYAGAPKPAVILGMPVGFVGAAESKDALAENPRGVPFAIVRGRMGGSAMTAAALNALARTGI